MDVFRLNPTTFLPDMLIDDYTSMIWTERYIGSGEFEMVTSNVFPLLQSLPEGSLVGIRESDEVMMIDDRNIDVDDDNVMTLKIIGKSLETFLKHRAHIATVYNTPWKALKQYRPSEMASLILWNNLVNATGQDPTRTNWTIDTKTAIPNAVVMDKSTLGDPPKNWWLEQGEVYPFFTDVLAICALGVKATRPNRTGGDVIFFDTSATASRGAVIKQNVANVTQLKFEIYNGLDRTRFQTDRPSVIFHYESGHINKPGYLFSVAEYKTVATVVSSFGSISVYPNSSYANLSGLNRRVHFIDGGDAGDQDYDTFKESLTQKGQAELREHAKIRLYDGEISSSTPYVYGVDYKLGDIVTVLANLGWEQSMQVTEYVRTADAEGIRGYPGLSAEPIEEDHE